MKTCIQTVSQVAIAFDRAIKLKGEAKLQGLREVRDQLHALEKQAAEDYSFPLEEIRAIRRLLPDVDSGMARLLGARKAAETRKARKG